MRDGKEELAHTETAFWKDAGHLHSSEGGLHELHDTQAQSHHACVKGYSLALV